MQQFVNAKIGELRLHGAGVETRNVCFERGVDIVDERSILTATAALDQARHIEPRGVERLQNIVTGCRDKPCLRHIGFVSFRFGAFERGVKPRQLAGALAHAAFQSCIGALQRLRRLHARRDIGERGHQSSAGHMIGAYFDDEAWSGDALEERLST